MVGGDWRLAVGNWRLVVVGGGWRRLVVGDKWLVVVGSGWRLAVGRRWRLAAVGGSWRLAVGGPLGRSLRAVLDKKKTGSLRNNPLGRHPLASGHQMPLLCLHPLPMGTQEGLSKCGLVTGGVQTQLLTPTPPQLFGPCWGGGPWGGGRPVRGSRVPQHTCGFFEKKITHWGSGPSSQIWGEGEVRGDNFFLFCMHI